ncbi:MAG TPA: hypothetical protein IAA74_01470 [Candidatus Excrementavichristensenella intestinipullorum]|nr:hypothetical protein [Candidatus Excrementavichristensenella intestinipullorum]
MQLDLLWKFMQVDIEADKFEAEMRQAPTRLKLLKQRDFLLEQQGNMKRIEAEVATMADRLDAIEDEAKRLSALLDKEQKELEEAPPQGQEEVDKAIASMQKLVDSLTRYEQELQKIRKDSDARDRQQKEIRVRAAKTKAEYDQLKKVYDVEFKADSQKLKALRDKTEQASRSVEAKLLERYRAIKQHSTPPMALLVGDQCGGCHMTLPSVMLRDIQSGEKIVECDNCGRIIYVPVDA